MISCRVKIAAINRITSAPFAFASNNWYSSMINSFLNKGQPEDMEDYDWDLLNSQAFSMRGYNYVLSARIRRFKAKYKQIRCLGV